MTCLPLGSLGRVFILTCLFQLVVAYVIDRMTDGMRHYVAKMLPLIITMDLLLITFVKVSFCGRLFFGHPFGMTLLTSCVGKLPYTR